MLATPAGSVPASAGRCPLPAHGPFVPVDVPEAPELVTLLREVRDAAEPELEMERYRSRVRQRDSRDGTMRIRSVDRLEEDVVQRATEAAADRSRPDVHARLHGGVVGSAWPIAAG